MKWLPGLVVMLSTVTSHGLAQSTSGNDRRVVVPLEAVADDRPAPFFAGLTNIFFAPLDGAMRDSVRIAPGWMHPEIADVIDRPSLRKVRVLRFSTEGDTTRRYVLDTAGTLDFTNVPLLHFERVGEMMVAGARLGIRTVAGREVAVPLQVMYAGKYTYARIAEARMGHAEIANKRYAVRVQPRSRNDPFYTTGGGTQFLVDFDADGAFAQGAARLINGRPVAAEEVQPDAPFALGGISYEIESIDSAGSRLTLRPSTRTTAVAPGFKHPPFVAPDLSGRTFTLQADRRRPTLLEFWSIECPFSEGIRESLNALYLDKRDQFSWIAMSRETNAAAVEEFLRSKPRSARVVLGDSATWSRFNPNTSTPLFVLIDTQGTVAFVTSGASALPAIAAKLDELLAGKVR